MPRRDRDETAAQRQGRQQRRLEHLQLLKQARGVQRSRIAARLGVGVGQVSELFNGKVELGAETQSAILETLGVDEAEFLAGVEGRFHAEVYLARVLKPRKRQAEHVEERARKTPSKPYEVRRLPELAAGLQELRLLDAEAARTLAFDVLATDFHERQPAAPSALCQACVALAAIYRTRGNYGATAFFLLRGLHTAGRVPGLRAPVLRAVASLARDLGDLDEAVAAAVQTGAEYLAAADYCGLGRSLTALGGFHVYRGDLTTALTALRCGLPIVSADEWFIRYAAFQTLALCHLYRGELEEALEFAERGLEVLDSESAAAPLPRAAVLWLRAEIQLAIGRPEQAADDLGEVLQVYMAEGFSALDCALVATRLALAYLLAADLEALSELKARVSGLAKRFKKSEKLLAATFADLLRKAQVGEVTVELVAESYHALLAGAENPPCEATLPKTPHGSKMGPAPKGS